jgi:hypothetical protein
MAWHGWPGPLSRCHVVSRWRVTPSLSNLKISTDKDMDVIANEYCYLKDLRHRLGSGSGFDITLGQSEDARHQECRWGGNGPIKRPIDQTAVVISIGEITSETPAARLTEGKVWNPSESARGPQSQ